MKLYTTATNKHTITAAKFQPGGIAVRQVFPTLVSKLSRDKDVAVFIPADNLAAGVTNYFKMIRLLIIVIISLTIFSDVFGQDSRIDSTILRVESANIDNMIYTATIKTDYTLYLTDSNGNLVLKINNSYPNIEFLDFDNDGMKDLMISHISNIPGIQDFVKYDTKSKSFKVIENFTKFPDSKPIKGTKYFYSYHRSGCADKNWDSDLFYIEDFKTIEIGNISGRECDNMDEKDGIYIYKIQVNKKELIETLPIESINKYQDYKWGFIADYWTRNYNEFK